MEKTSYPLKVYVSNKNYIYITQEEFGHDESIIIIHPSQVNLLIKWLRESKKEAEAINE